MKKIIFPLVYVASIFSNELIEQQNTENLLASNNITFNAESVDFSSLNHPIPNEEIHAPILEKSYKRPWLAAGLSSIFPGLGQLYLGDERSALIMAGTGGLSLGITLAEAQKDHANGNILISSGLAYSTSLYYSTYAAYRDARVANGITNYSYKMPMENFKDLTYAPFQQSVLKKAEVWGGILGAVALASVTAYFAYPEKGEVKIAASSSSPALLPPLALPVAIGEESYFRGFLQSAISENMNPMAGLVISSLAFGAAHIPNAQALDEEDRWRYYSFSLPLITALGAYCGWMTQKNHSLKESVALHMWYDFIIFTVGAFSMNKASISHKQYAVSFPF
jgi:membrane protease YdiL (CAAX protease family)